MVAGKVKVGMGFPKPKSTTPDNNTDQLQPPSPAGSGKNKGGAGPVFSRSFGVYFPRSSSAQVQPRPPSPEVSDLLRLIEDLREREHRLKTELLEYKLFKESVSIVPFLENQIESLNAENERLKTALSREREKFEQERRESEKRMKEMEAEITELKKTASEELLSSSSSSSSLRFQGLMEASTRSSLMRNFLNNPNAKVKGVNNFYNNNKSCTEVNLVISREETEKPPSRHSLCNSEELLTESALSLSQHQHDDHVIRSRAPRVPKPPPPKRSASGSSLSSSSSFRSCSSSSSGSDQAFSAPPPPPPPPPPPAAVKKVVPPPPPPPPPPPKGARERPAKVRRVPEVVEFYHSLMRRDSRRDPGGGGTAAETVPATANARDMIGEIENRSAHLLAIKTDVETQGEFISFLIKEVEDAAFTDIEDVVPFVKWLDDELSYLVDERAVLKHFDWPEQKADALREAAFGYCDLVKLESEASLFQDDARQPCSPALKKMQILLEKLEHGVYNLSRMRESATNRYKGFHIPMDWMLETGIISQIKLASVKLAMKYMKRISAELEGVGGGPEEEELIVQGVRFAFRVHQFAGGFDVETMRAFQELRDKATDHAMYNSKASNNRNFYASPQLVNL